MQPRFYGSIEAWRAMRTERRISKKHFNEVFDQMPEQSELNFAHDIEKHFSTLSKLGAHWAEKCGAILLIAVRNLMGEMTMNGKNFLVSSKNLIDDAIKIKSI